MSNAHVFKAILLQNRRRQRMKKFIFLIALALFLATQTYANATSATTNINESISSQASSYSLLTASDGILEFEGQIAGFSIMQSMKKAMEKSENELVIKADIDADAGKLNWVTLIAVAAAAIFVTLLNKKKKQEFD